MLAYVGHQIVAHVNEGSSDYLLVTFCQLNSEHAATDHYFLQAQIEHGDISCVGVMTTERGFYLSSEMDAIVRLVNQQRRGRRVIVFGQSMGGYGAMKYSAALSADVVLAFSPFYSMDPDDLRLPTDKHRKILAMNMSMHGITMRPEFKGMAIREPDVHGRLIIVHDPSEFIDTYNAGLMIETLPRAEIVTMPHAGHVIYDPAWDAPTVSRLMRAALSDDQAAIGRAFTDLRRNHVNFMRRSLEKAAHRKPLLCAKAMRSPRVTRHQDFHGLAVDPYNLKLIHRLCSRGERVAAIEHLAFIEWSLQELEPDAVEIDEGSPIEMLERNYCLLLSHHGTFLAYDTDRRLVRFEPHVFNRNDLFPVIVKIEDGVPTFCIHYRGLEIPASLLLGKDAVEFSLELVLVDEFQVALRRGDTYIGAPPTGELQILDRIGHQQRFVPLPLLVRPGEVVAPKRPEPVVQRPNFAMAPAGVLAHPAFDPRSGNRWRKLFNGLDAPRSQ